MEMVAASKLRATQEAAQKSKPYSLKLKELLTHLTSGVTSNNPLLQKREIKKVCFVMVSADRGLAGGYNANLIKLAHNAVEECTQEKVIVTIGSKAKDFFGRRNYNIIKAFPGAHDYPTMSEAVEVGEFVRDLYCSEEVDEVRIIYTDFVNAVTHTPTDLTLLPIEQENKEEAAESEYILEPDKDGVLDKLLPLYLKNQIFKSLMQAKASEHGSRMTAMHSATENASEMIDKLNLSYNRARQAAITTEIAEIVGGANALQG